MSMLIVKKHGKLLEFPVKLFVYGMRKIKSALCVLHPDNVDIIYKTLKTVEVATLLFWRKQKSVIVEFLPQNKWTTLEDKKIFSDKNILITSWFQTLVQELTGNVKDLKPFWNKQCQENSGKLWLPTEIDCVDLPLNYLNSSSKKMELDSWFLVKNKVNPASLNSQKTFSPSFISIPVGRWEKNDTLIRARKLKLKLTEEQKKIFRQWRGTRNYVYNKVLYKINKEKEKKSFYSLRDKYITETSRKYGKNPEIKKWETETPKDIRASAIKELLDNFRSAFSNLRNGNIKKFKINYLKKENKPAFTIPLSSIKSEEETEMIKRNKEELEKARKKLGKNTNGEKKKVNEMKKQITLTKNQNKIYIYPDTTKEIIQIDKKFLKKKVIIDSDCKIVEQNGIWYLIVPQKIKPKTVQETENCCAIDPGVRSFLTVYSEEKVSSIEINRDVIRNLLIKIDKNRSLRDTKQISKRHAKRKEKKLIRRLDNLIDELHWKSINYLTNTFFNIIIPPFGTQKITMKSENRGLNRNLLQLKHYLFQQRLKQKCEQKDRLFTGITEEYTTQTCGKCGILNNKVGSNKVFTCKNKTCGLTIDRDFNGARNILLKCLFCY